MLEKKISVFDDRRTSRSYIPQSEELHHVLPTPRLRMPIGGAFAGTGVGGGYAGMGGPGGGIEGIMRKRNEYSLREESTQIDANVSISSGGHTERRRGIFDEQSVQEVVVKNPFPAPPSID